MPNDAGFPHAEPKAELVRAALAGLTAERKSLPPVLFYDDEGCRLFYEITRLPEYYLTRTEMALLAARAAEMVPERFRSGTLVEYGGSDETKARFLLDQPGQPFAGYVPVDIAGPALRAMRRRMATSHPWLTVRPVVADFLRPLELPDLPGPRMGFLPGSTLGNLEPAEASRFLATVRNELGGGWFLLGADLRKPPEVLLPAYNDAAGVTAAFNLNMLTRLNREAGADFDIGRFAHRAVWNDAASRIEMHLVARRDHTVRVGGTAIGFREGETIHTENSYKHTRPALTKIAGRAGWEIQRTWTDPAGWFGVFLLFGG